MPEWRKDPILDRWVVIATERGKRPSDFMVPREEKRGGECPLCERHELETPPEVLAYRERGSGRDRPGWWVRVVPNKFPALRIEGQTDIRNYGLYRIMDGVGAHEVVVETADHGKTMEDLNEYQVQEIIRAWRDRSLDLRRDERFKYIQVFKNYGSTAGASLEHSHSQIIATPMIPGKIMRKIEGLTQYARKTGRCILCEMVEQELKEQNRIVVESSRFVGIAPFASRFPFETWIIPREHQPDFGHLREDQIGDLAYILNAILKKLSAALRRPPFNMVINTAPVNVGMMDKMVHLHWHIEILPRLTIAAGFELGTGFYINPTPPEMAASELRETVIVYDRPYNQNYEGVGKYV
ncbi:MAG: galactose-1-phosphate uridylyltransferase [Firmicutes bacterium]|nr:galactose-1-phosphate uridylyltransferase [Bacillota bacterium]